ncbi:MAG TPA: acyl-CoA thioesterase II [Candidatus Acidoferrales bacterium]|nr:acyl-CoA thioesterase II [Candidatus Acidoferrales bacterium]
MAPALLNLLSQLDLETLDENLFRGTSADLGGFSVFGGQVVAQALVAAQRTLDPARSAHSLHAYFLRPGDMKASIVYQVECLRDGKSFSTRRVLALQHGKPIFSLSASFQVTEDGLDHQAPAPQAPPPESLPTEQELRARLAERVPEPLRRFLNREVGIEMRPVAPVDFFTPERRAPIQQVWLRVAHPLPDEPGLHRALLAYASDFNLLGTSLLPHGITFFQGNLQGASLDHALWFHRPFRIDDWILYHMESPSASGARGFNLGGFYTRDGRRIASSAQEGLLRLRMGNRPT